MRGRGRSVLSFVFACALIGALAPAARGAHHGATQRSSDFDRGWKFALVNRTDITDPTGAYANAADPAYDDARGARSTSRTTGASSSTRRPARHRRSGTGFLPGRPRLVPQDVHAARARRPASAISRRVRRRLHGLVRLPQRHAGRRPPVRLHRLQRRPHRPLHTDGTRRTCSPSRSSNQQPSSRWYSGSGIYRHVHLVVTDPVHVARHGTFVTTPDLESTDHARATPTVHVAHARSPNDAAPPAVDVVTGPGRARATSSRARRRSPRRRTAPTRRPARSTTRTCGRPTTPYLYTLQHRAARSAATSVDSTTTTLRRPLVRDRPERGLLRSTASCMKLQGVDLHHDQGALGSAINNDALLRADEDHEVRWASTRSARRTTRRRRR